MRRMGLRVNAHSVMFRMGADGIAPKRKGPQMASVRKRSWTTAKGERRTAWAVDFPDAAGGRQRRQFDTKREADAFRVQSEGQVRAGTFRPEADKVAISTVVESYLAECRGRAERGEEMSRHHLETVEGIMTNHVLNPTYGVGGVKLAHLTPSQVAAYRDRVRKAGVSVPMTRKIIGALARVLAFAVRNELIAVNSARGVEVIGRRGEGSKKIVPPGKADLKALLAGADPEFRFVISFASRTGLRAGELWALRWRHVELKKCLLDIETRVDRFGVEDTTKTNAGVRQVPIAKVLAQELREWRARSAFSKEADLVFPNKSGGFRRHDNEMTRLYRPLCKRVGTGGINWHSLRHFAISTWIESGLSPKVVQTYAGHTSLEMTMDRYGHLFPSDAGHEAMDRIAASLL